MRSIQYPPRKSSIQESDTQEPLVDRMEIDVTYDGEKKPQNTRKFVEQSRLSLSISPPKQEVNIPDSCYSKRCKLLTNSRAYLQ